MPNDPKVMARSLRVQLRGRGLELSHGECLDMVARQLGHHDWNVLAARSHRPALVKVRRSCEWTAVNADRELGRISASKRPDGRWFVACDTWYDGVQTALIDAVIDDLQQPLHATVDEADAESLRRYAACGFVMQRRDDEFSIDVAAALAALDAASPPSPYTVVSAVDVEEADLRILDDTLRIDVPAATAGSTIRGSSGNTPSIRGTSTRPPIWWPSTGPAGRPGWCGSGRPRSPGGSV